MQKLLKLAQGIDYFIEKIANLSMIFLWILCFLVFFLAIALNFSYVNSQLDDLSIYCFALMVYLSFSYTLKQDKHVRLDLIYANYSLKTKTLSWMIVNFFFVLPFSLVLIKYGFDFTWQSFSMAESSPNGKLPYYFIFKSFMIIGFSLLAISAVSESIKALISLFKKDYLQSSDAYTQELNEVKEILGR